MEGRAAAREGVLPEEAEVAVASHEVWAALHARHCQRRKRRRLSAEVPLRMALNRMASLKQF